MAGGVQKVLIKRSTRKMTQRFHSQLLSDNGHVLWSSEKYSNIGACEVPAFDLADRLSIKVEYNYAREKHNHNDII